MLASRIIEFPLINIEDSLIECVRKTHGSSNCLVVKNNKIVRIIKPSQILEGFLEGKIKISELIN